MMDQSEATTRAEQARQHELRGDLSRAIELWRAAVKSDPASVEARVGYGRALCLDERHADAREVLVSVLATDAVQAEALYFLARAELAMGLAIDAQHHFRQAIAIDPLYNHPVYRTRLLGEPEPAPLPASAAPLPRVAPPAPVPTAASLKSPPGSLLSLWGFDTLKHTIRQQIVEPFATHDRPASFLLFGPQDCGKQFIARCIAGELGASVLEFECETLESLAARERAQRELRDFLTAVPARRPKVVTLLRLEKLFTTTQAYGPDEHGLPAALSFLRPVMSASRVLICFHSYVPWLLNRALLQSRWLETAVFVPPPDAGARRSILASAFGDALPETMIDSILERTAGFTTGDLSEFTMLMQRYLIRERDPAREQLTRYLEEDRTAVGPIDWAVAPHVLSRIHAASIEWFQEARRNQFHRRFKQVEEASSMTMEKPKTAKTATAEKATAKAKTATNNNNAKPAAAKAAPKAAAKTTAKAAPKAAAKTTAKTAPKAALKTSAKAAPKAAAKTTAKAAAKTTAKPAAKTSAKAAPKAGKMTAKAAPKAAAKTTKAAPKAAAKSTAKAAPKAAAPKATSRTPVAAAKPAARKKA